MAQLFGTPLGQLAFDQNLRDNQLANMTLQEGAVKLQSAKMDLSNRQRMMDAMSKQGDLGADLPTQLDTLAQLAIRSGSPEQAAEYAKASSGLRKNTALMQDAQVKAVSKKLNILGSLMDGVSDETSWRQANMQYTMETGEQSPWGGMPYSPDMVGKIRNGVASAKDRALTEAAKARTADSIAETKERETRVPLLRAQTVLAEKRAAAVGKNGANLLPKAQDVRMIMDLQAQDYNFAGTEDSRVIAEPVAERMVDLMRTEGLTRSQAAERAYGEAKSDQTYVGLRPRARAKGTLASPLIIPKTEKELRPNMWYMGQGKYAGQLLQWTGDGFVEQGEKEREADEEEEDQ
jgi:hypothetical protein